MMDKTDAVATYIAEVAKLAKTGQTTELSFRPALSKLLSALMPDLTPINEAKRMECGAPDFILIDKNKLPVMFVETKDLDNSDLDGKKANKEQFDRYKAALDTIIFTDFLDFHFYRHNGQSGGEVRIAEWNGEKVSAKSENYDLFVDMMKESACSEPQKIDSAKRLAELMAGKARMLQNTAEKYLKPIVEVYDSAPKGTSPEVTPLLDMMLGFRKLLMPNVGADEFSDIFAQTLTYGMFAARLNDPTPDDFSRYEAMGRIPNSNQFLKRLFLYVANNLEEELEWIVDDLADLFKAADVSKIMKDYGKSTGISDPMVHFYEDFLREYDAGLRKDRGVWYTPIQIVRFIVSAVDWTLQSRFGLQDGLADSSKTQIIVEEATEKGKKISHKVKKIVHRIQVLDPATGTGTFLAESIRQIREKFDGNEGLWPEYVVDNLLPRLNGFELLMASYTMAHVKMDFALKASGVTPNGNERFRVFLTDSLTEWHDELPGGLFASALAAEQKGADEVKRDIPVMVVMGNPPYSGESQNKGKWIMDLMEAYKVEPGGAKKLQERTPKWLNDDYVKFIRLAEYYVEKNGSGIIAYITPHGFLDNPTFRGMRWHLMQTFNEIWTLNLHGNTKKKEIAPDGGKDECVFAIQQGVAITLMVKTGKQTHKESEACRVYYADLWGKRKDKFAALEKATMNSVEWQKLNPVTPMLFFVPKDTAGEMEYNKGFRLDDLMPVNGMGVTSAHDSFVIGSRQELERRFSEFQSSSEHENLYTKFNVKEKAGWDICKGYRKLKSCADINSFIKPIAYRPFDDSCIFYEDMLVWRSVRKLFDNFLCDNNIGLCCIRICSRDEGLPVFVIDKIADKSLLSSKDNANVFPLWLYEENKGKMEKRANMNKNIVAQIGAAIADEATPEDIFAYIYGILHTPHYRTKFKEFLKSDFPRIPYPKDAAQFKAVVKIGRSLIDTHLMRDVAPGLAETRARFPKIGSNIVEEVRFEKDCVFINAEQFFNNVPKVAWEMPIGGYKPAEKWLKDRKERTLSGDDIKHYQRIIIALLKTDEAAKELDAIFAE